MPLPYFRVRAIWLQYTIHAVEPPSNGQAFGDLETHRNLAHLLAFLVVLFGRFKI